MKGEQAAEVGKLPLLSNMEGAILALADADVLETIALEAESEKGLGSPVYAAELRRVAELIRTHRCSYEAQRELIGELADALEFYAREDNYTFPSCADDAGSPAEQDEGRLARAALAKLEAADDKEVQDAD